MLRRREIRDKMVRIVVQTHRRYGAQLHAYCVMVNHIHLVSRAPDDMHSSRFMQILKDKASNTILPILKKSELALMSKQVGLDSRQLFMRSFDSIVIRTPRVLHSKIRYTHMNPVAASMAKQATDYRWSSAAANEAGLWQPDSGLDLTNLWKMINEL
jgi:REP element-mobilizing transposase RayT